MGLMFISKEIMSMDSHGGMMLTGKTVELGEKTRPPKISQGLIRE
jgi:hypothetical protein